MISAQAISGDGSYYIGLAREDYYLEGGEPPGRWLGSGIELFGLFGKCVEKKDFKAIINGFSPNKSRSALVMNAGTDRRQKGHDFCFSAPKSVSIIWAAASPETRQIVQAAQAKSVDSAIHFLEQQATFTRRGKGGELVERAKLMVAAFEHSTSRDLDPNLHTHCILFNVCARHDGTTGTLHGQVIRDKRGNVIETYNALYRHIHAAGAVYRMELANQLSKKLGLEIRIAENGFSFEVVGISPEAIKEFSKRRNEIEKVLGKLGTKSAKVSESVALETRTDKKNVARSELIANWQKQLKPFGITPEFVQDLENQQTQNEISDNQIRAIINSTAEKLSAKMGSIELRELFKEVAINLQSEGVSWDRLSHQMEFELAKGKLISLGVDRTDPVISTVMALEKEFEFESIVHKSKTDQRHAIDPKIVDHVLYQTGVRRSFQLSDEQKNAVRYLTHDADKPHAAIRVLTGDAGSGKTTILKTAKQVWTRAGYTVVGACLSNNAAQTLQQETGINSDTITKWNIEAKKTGLDSAKHHVRMLGRAAVGKTTWKNKGGYSLDSKTVLVIDEAAMADTRQLLSLVKKARESQSMVVLAGDNKQCQAIEHGGAFVSALGSLGTFRLTENWRQKDKIDQITSRFFSKGCAASALRILANQGRIKVDKSLDKAIDSLVSEWAKHGTSKPKENLILVGRHSDRLTINAKCQRARRGAFTRAFTASLTNHEGQKLFAGDRIHFRETLLVDSKGQQHKIPRGSFGTIKSLSPNTNRLRVCLDNGQTLVVSNKIDRGKNRKLFPRKTCSTTQISLGYAVTTHASQGASVDRSYVLATGCMQDRELTYVQATRARLATRFYLTEEEAGKELTQLANHRSGTPKNLNKKRDKSIGHRKDSVENSPIARNMSRSRQKHFGLERSVNLTQIQTVHETGERVRLRSR